MTAPLDLRDIQGNIVRAYGRYGFPHARYFLFHFDDGAAGRRAVLDLLPLVTTAERWSSAPDGLDRAGIERPKVALNLAFTWLGLLALEVPIAPLIQFPPEVIEGMAARAPLLEISCMKRSSQSFELGVGPVPCGTGSLDTGIARRFSRAWVARRNGGSPR